jgi:CheY-like chemotaxis protein
MKSMLIVDSPTLAKLFATVFEKLGWTVAVSNNRESAMSRVAGSEPYDLVLLSYHLSGGTDGVQLSRFIRSLEHRMTTAIVMLTSSGEITDEAKAAGVDEVLIKPVNVSTLIWAVNKHVS